MGVRLRVTVLIGLVGVAAPPRQLPAQNSRPPAARQQSRLSVDSGTLVRFHTPTATMSGRLLAPLSRADSFVHYCRYPGPPCNDARDTIGVRKLPVSQIAHVDVQTGNGVGHGVLLGGFIGVAVGAFLGYALAGLEESQQSATSPAVRGALTVGAIGAGLGAVIGTTSIHWRVGPW